MVKKTTGQPKKFSEIKVSDKDDMSRLTKARNQAKKEGNTRGVNLVDAILNRRKNRARDRAMELKKNEGRPQYNPRGPN